ncbi:MAG TPA: tripartite tricarboxylate transporter substrate binding protein [Alphaproteobacteria bacterium]
MRNRHWAWLALVLTFAVAPATVHAQGSSGKPIKLVVTVGPGSAPDVIARMLAPLMSQELGRSVLVENRTGAGGNIAAVTVLHDKHDGAAAIIAGSATITLNPLLVSNAGFETRDFKLVVGVADLPSYFIVGASVEANTVADVVALLKGNPGKFVYAAPPATVHHMAAEQLAYKAGFEWTRISFRDPSQQTSELVSGRVPFAFASLPSVQAYIADGTLRAMGIASPQRVASHPQIPAIAETFPGYAEGDFVGLFVPADTPADALEALAAATIKAREAPETRPRLDTLGMDVLRLDRATLESRMQQDVKRRSELIQARGLKLD